MIISPVAVCNRPPPVETTAQFPLAGTGGHTQALLYQGPFTVGQFPACGYNSIWVYVVNGNGGTDEVYRCGNPDSGVDTTTASFRHHTTFVDGLGNLQGSQPRIQGVSYTIPVGQFTCYIGRIGPVNPGLGTQTVNNGTSTSSNTIGLGSKTFSITGDISGAAAQGNVPAYFSPAAGMTVRAGSGANFVEGLTTAYTPGVSITINVTNTSGAGTFSSWQFSAPFSKWQGDLFINGLKAGTTTNLAPIYPAGPGNSNLIIPGPLGNIDRMNCLMIACQDPTMFADWDTDAKVFNQWLAIQSALKNGRPVPAFNRCQFQYLASNAGPTTWTDTQQGVVLSVPAGDRPPVVKQAVYVPVGRSGFPVPTLVYPRNDLTRNSSNFYQGDNVALQATVSSAVGLVKVQWLLADNTVIGQDLSGNATATATWNAPAVGSYTVKAVAYWQDGSTTTSSIQPVTVWSSSVVSSPLNIFAGILLVWMTGRLGITAAGTALTAWLDQKSGFNYAGTASYNSADSTLNGPQGARPTVTGNGVVTTGDRLSANGPDFPAPSTTPFWISAVGKQITSVSGRNPWANANTIAQLTQDGLGNVSMRNGGSAVNNTFWGLNIWKTLMVNYANAIGVSYIQVGGAAPTATGAEGNSDPSAFFTWFARNTVQQCNCAFAETIITFGTPSATQIAQWAAYLSHWYPIDVLTDR